MVEHTVGVDYKPATDSELYEAMGAVETFGVTNKADALVLKAPPVGRGTYRRRKSIPLSQELTLKAKLQDANQLVMESIFLLAGAITIGTAQQPLKQSKPITGWLKIEQRDQTDTLINTMFLWVEMMVTEGKSAEKEYAYDVTWEVLDSELNTYNLNALTAN
ncbi:hypothetical protein [Verrucomicrobium spinosum]|nr:hypothetical protein [Verrucomicrobium spinosum]